VIRVTRALVAFTRTQFEGDGGTFLDINPGTRGICATAVEDRAAALVRRFTSSTTPGRSRGVPDGTAEVPDGVV
jgi:hypothetical protein